jgi:hypothetical protein
MTVVSSEAKMHSLTARVPGCTVLAVALLCCAQRLHASVILGAGTTAQGTAAIRGSDLTDPENDGQADADVGYNAVFSGNEEPAFGGGESAFNVFDNRVGGGNDKWCCGTGNQIPAEGYQVTAQLNAGPHILSSFTLTSGNDTPPRRPSVWEIRGSNDGANFTTIFSVNETDVATKAPNGDSDGDRTVFSADNQTVEFTAGTDFPVPASSGYQYFRFVVFDTPGSPGGNHFQLNEIEYFGTPVPEPSLAGAGAVALSGLVLRRRRAA